MVVQREIDTTGCGRDAPFLQSLAPGAGAGAGEGAGAGAGAGADEGEGEGEGKGVRYS